MTDNTDTQKNQDIYELPQILPRRLLDWYGENARALPWRRDTDPYHIWVSEIMLQQTGVAVVKDYYRRFLAAFPTVEALAAADGQEVLKLWEGLGYYSRARNLQKAARILVREQGVRFPDTYNDIVKLPGIGPYTAGAIASICFNQPTPAVDGNVVRVITRIAGICDEVTEAVKKRITASLKAIYPTDRPGDFTQSLMDLGAVVCSPNGVPKCDQCPVWDICAANRDGTTMSLPVKPQKQAKKQQDLTVFLLSCGDDIALRRRADSGLLAGLWELPNRPGCLDDTGAVALADGWGVKPAALCRSFRRSHVFTHIKWDMLCYVIECAAQPDRFEWASRRALSETYALPTAFKKLVEETGAE